jgi:integrase
MNDPLEPSSEIILASDMALLFEGPLPPAHKNPCATYLGGLAEGPSHRTTKSALEGFLRALIFHPPAFMEDPEERAEWRLTQSVDIKTFRWWNLRREHFNVARKVLMAEKATASANKYLIAARGVMWESLELGLISEGDFGKIERVKRVEGTALLAGRAFSREEVASVFTACDWSSPLGARDAAVFYVIWGSGVRRAELTKLDLSTVDMRARTLHVDGKRRKKRDVPISPEVVVALGKWLAVRGSAPGPLFYPNARTGEFVVGKRMAEQSVYDVLLALGQKVGISDISPHNARRTFITDQLDRGVDVLTVAKLVGHSDPRTTMLYDRRTEVAMRKAIDERLVPR